MGSRPPVRWSANLFDTLEQHVVILDSAGQTVARVIPLEDGDPVRIAQAIAHASLIAAAPDLLVACEELIAQRAWVRSDGEGCAFCLGRFVETHLPTCPITLARVAIAKATGGDR